MIPPTHMHLRYAMAAISTHFLSSMHGSKEMGSCHESGEDIEMEHKDHIIGTMDMLIPAPMHTAHIARGVPSQLHH